MNDSLKNVCNEKVFEGIFNKYAKDVKRFIFSKTRNAEMAEDIVQDTFVKIWEDCSNVVFDTVKSYLFTIANNQFLNIVKHKNVVHAHRLHHKKVSTNESPEFLLLEEEFLIKLETAIANLPEIQREVFLMNRIEKKKYKDIAMQLGISVKAVEKRMHGALLVLRKKIGNV